MSRIDTALRPLVTDARSDDRAGARNTAHAQPADGLDDLEQDHDAPAGLLARALGQHFEEQLGVLDGPEERGAAGVDGAAGFPEALVAALRGVRGRGEQVRVVGCEEGEEGVEGFGGQGRVGDAGAGEEVGQGAEGGFDGGHL